MHRSRVGQVLLDVPRPDREAEVRFWDAALNLASIPDPDDPEYTILGELSSRGIRLLVQEVGSPARAHLDIETDDIEAEVARLRALGAQEVARVKRWVVMRDPDKRLSPRCQCLARLNVTTPLAQAGEPRGAAQHHAVLVGVLSPTFGAHSAGSTRRDDDHGVAFTSRVASRP